jgi:signal transduction histidine kinase
MSADGLARTLARLHAERGVTIAVEVAADLQVRVDREDLDEMLGNLLDNACKWARSRARVVASREDDRIVVSVEDDGPGIEPSMRAAVLARGVRADEAAPGSGLGLSIVRDLADAYGGMVTLDASPMGGVRASLTLPAA